MSERTTTLASMIASVIPTGLEEGSVAGGIGGMEEWVPIGWDGED